MNLLLRPPPPSDHHRTWHRRLEQRDLYRLTVRAQQRHIQQEHRQRCQDQLESQPHRQIAPVFRDMAHAQLQTDRQQGQRRQRVAAAV